MTAARPAVRPCACGATPVVAHAMLAGIRTLRLTCLGCGNHGATLLYMKPEDAAKTRQAGIDGWNLSG